ncbi:MAG: type II secretion system secretin GspD [Desulfosalsimonas sp.]|uniref:type II secretion system secretin GspD n=1 Tax=Desulfosalsimonas sp. TaxID=3073848 RepID=UPI0039709167
MIRFQRQSGKAADIDVFYRAAIVALTICFGLFVSAAFCPVYGQNSQAQQQANPNTTQSPQQEGRSVSIDFNDVDISVFIKFISELTGRNFIVDQRVKGKITVISPTQISVQEAYRVFESVLDVHGYTTVDAGEITKIIPAPYARTMSIETKLKREGGSGEDKIVTQLIPLEYASPDEIKQLFAPLISKSSVIISYAPTNMLIVTDVYSNIKRLMRIIDAIDVPGTGREILMLPIEHSNAEDIVSIINSVFGKSQSDRRGDRQAITAVADKRTNLLIVQASEPNIERIRQLVNSLDKEMPRGKEKINVYYLENAKAEDLVGVLQELPASQEQQEGKKQAPIVSEAVQVTADQATNSLIIRAEKDDYDVLKSVIEKLDVPRAMVYIECLIMEVSKDKSFRLGAEWMAGGEGSYKDREGVYGGGFSGGAMGGDPGYNFAFPDSDSGAPLPPGFSLGILGENIEVGGITFPTIRALIQAYQKDRDVQILSTPQILTTDNATAKIRVGRNIPYLTRTASGETEFSNYEYQDVGILLEITPQINKDRKIRLELLQEVTKLESADDFRPTTLKRTIDTVVEVNDTNTVVIGGLIDESLSKTEYRVPCLGGVPLIGWLFKSLSDSSEQTNLFVFLTPRVMAAPEEAAEFYKDNKKKFQTVPEETIKLYGPPQNKNARSANGLPEAKPETETGPEPDQPETDPTEGRQYTVKKNDTLYSIARRHNIALETLLEINGLTEDSVIRPGDQLTVSPTGPEPDQPETDPTEGRQYTVKKNDTLYSIARRHNIALDMLLEINDLTEDSVIRPGDQLTVSP